MADVWPINALRTTIHLDGELLEILLSMHPGLTKTEAIDTAVRAYLASLTEMDSAVVAATTSNSPERHRWPPSMVKPTT